MKSLKNLPNQVKIIESLQTVSVENYPDNCVNNCTMKKINELTLSIEEAVSYKKNYVLSLCGTQSESEFRIATALSDYSCNVYSVGETLSKTLSINHYDSPITGIRFSPLSKNILYISTNEGRITACDLRAKGKIVSEFRDDTENGKLKPIASFDINCDESFIAGGTEHTGGDAFILFWDIRHNNSKISDKHSLVGGYWESHMDDITCLAFHPDKSNVLASGSMDGLINVFDLKEPTEELALTYSLNTESSADRLGWLGKDNIWCTTHTCLQLWHCKDATPYNTFDRQALAASQNVEVDDCYFVRVHTNNSLEEPFLLAGGSCAQTNEKHLSCLSITHKKLETCCNLIGNKQIVRDSWFHEKSGTLVTGGEDGTINLWKGIDATATPAQEPHQLVTKLNDGTRRDRHHRTKPY